MNAELPTYELSDWPAEVAREIFLRSNNGKPLNRAQKL